MALIPLFDMEFGFLLSLYMLGLIFSLLAFIMEHDFYTDLYIGTWFLVICTYCGILCSYRLIGFTVAYDIDLCFKPFQVRIKQRVTEIIISLYCWDEEGIEQLVANILSNLLIITLLTLNLSHDFIIWWELHSDSYMFEYILDANFDSPSCYCLDSIEDCPSSLTLCHM